MGRVAGAARVFDDLQSKLDRLGKLDAEVTSLRRLEQGFLRDYLFRSANIGTCAICGFDFPIGLLVAAHIKPRARCTDAERRDFINNVVPMCRLGCDALFEGGFVVVEAGKIRARLAAYASDRLKELLNAVNGRATPAWKAGRVRYFRWHARQRMRKVAAGLTATEANGVQS